jgi:hypothetical protein
MATAIGTGATRRSNDHAFYLCMAGAFMLIAFGGFLPTYWLPVAAGTFHRPPIVHIHGLMFFTWTLYYCSQTVLVAAGRTPDHRNWGLLGIALFATMVCTVLAGQIAVIRLNEALGFGDQARRFAAVSLTALPLLIAMFALAIANVRRPETHKRLMLLVMIMMMQPAIARVFQAFLAPAGAATGGPPPPFIAVPPGLVADLLILVAMAYDWRTRGGRHRVYAIGLPLVIVNQLMVIPIAASAGWMAFAKGFERLLG